MKRLCSTLIYLTVLAVAMVPAAWVISLIPSKSLVANSGSSSEADPFPEAEPVLQVAPAVDPQQQAEAPQPAGTELLAEQKTMEERFATDRRTIMGARPQDWYATWRASWRPVSERSRYEPGVMGERHETTRVLPKPIRRFASVGPYARLVNDIIQAKPKAVFVAGYRDLTGRYHMSSFYRRASHARPLGSYHNMFVTTALSNSTNFYVFKTTGQTHTRPFVQGYFNRFSAVGGGPDRLVTPAMRFYQYGAASARVNMPDLTRLFTRQRQKEELYAKEYGERRFRPGYGQRMRPTTLATLPPAVMKRIPTVVYFKDRGWGTYWRSYYRPPVPRVYRDVNYRLQTFPVAHITPRTTP